MPKLWPDCDGEMAGRIRTHPWGATSLGPAECWPDRLRVMVEFVLASPNVSSLVCGSDRLLIYNDAAARLYGDLHPAALGRPLPESFPEGWKIVAPLYARAFSGETVQVNSQVMDTRGEGDSTDIFDATLTPVRDRAGQVAFVHMSGQEIGARLRAEAALRTNEEQLRTLTNLVPILLWQADPSGRGVSCNQRWLEHTGQALEETQNGGWLDSIHPDDRETSRRAFADAYQAQRPLEAQHRIRGRDGQYRWFLVRQAPLRDANGRVARWFGAAVDIHEQYMTLEALRESEARFQQFGRASSDVLWIRDAATLQLEYVSPAFESVYGIVRDWVLDGGNLRRWSELIVPEDRNRILETAERVRAGESTSCEFRVERPSDGAIRWIHNTGFPLFDAAGRVQRIGGIARDVTDAKDGAERTQVLVAELQHRTRNLIAVIRSLADKTLAGSLSLDDFRDRFRTRLDALSRVNGLLSRLEDGNRVAFDELIRAELSALGEISGSGARISLAGPAGIRLRSGTLQTLALALHELATNALKYGALSSPKGRLRIQWRSMHQPTGERRLRVLWEETGVMIPPDQDGAPRRRGYGRELIEQALPYQLKARTSYELGPDGVRCSIDLPISAQSGGASA